MNNELRRWSLRLVAALALIWFALLIAQVMTLAYADFRVAVFGG